MNCLPSWLVKGTGVAPSKKVTSVLTLDTAVVSVDRGTWLTSFGAVGLGLDIFELDNRAQLKDLFLFFLYTVTFS